MRGAYGCWYFHRLRPVRAARRQIGSRKWLRYHPSSSETKRFGSRVLRLLKKKSSLGSARKIWGWKRSCACNHVVPVRCGPMMRKSGKYDRSTSPSDTFTQRNARFFSSLITSRSVNHVSYDSGAPDESAGPRPEPWDVHL